MGLLNCELANRVSVVCCAAAALQTHCSFRYSLPTRSAFTAPSHSCRRRPPSETLLGRDLDHVPGQPSQLSGKCQHIVELHCEPLGSATSNHCIQNDLRPCLGTIDNGIRGQLVGKAARGHEEQPDKVCRRDVHVVVLTMRS